MKRIEQEESNTNNSATLYPEEEFLVQKARTGDQQAFGELVRRHRAKAVSWANSMTRDPFLAEDIVQDAFIKAFFKIGSLTDNERFKPWLKKIIQNQALMKLRRGGPYAKEMPLTSFSTEKEPQGREQNDWRDLDYILFRLTQSYQKRREQHYDPEASLMKQETLTYIHSLLEMLNPRERHIFEAYFFEEYSPKEIAIMLDASTASVYNYISSSRKKIRRERIRLHLHTHLENRKKQGCPAKKILPSPTIF